ncbi:MAG TPA: dienelactone hydrolase family protein [Candidatus Limnocylindria bacterium]|nr:dienelactone hydrolase family protein [Candidatus Limnocylindria bacterium]
MTDVTIPVEGSAGMPALIALPERTPAPGVLIINDVFGRSPFYDHLARRLAEAGFVAITPEYFFREGALPEPTRDAAVARSKRLDYARWGRDMSAAVDWLRSEVNRAVGTIGFCMGGTAVLLLAAARDDLAASVSYYGFPADARTDVSPIELAPKMHGPILGHWGDQDTGAGMENVEKLRAGLASARVEHEFRIYPGLGHGFLKASLDDPKTPGYEQACASWTRTLEFYRRCFARSPAGAR